ncbi:MAG: hypothetical protein LBS82_05805, partial [Spirochaetaceae bacterium]|nr:hypothetical protein [Spirochaetaceae bacterium]
MKNDCGVALPTVCLIPLIKRARGWRLYTADGRRLVDLWQCGGKALLGHRAHNVLRDVKNAAEKGLFAPLPSVCEGRLLRLLARLFPGKAYRIYRDGLSLAAALKAGGFPPERVPLWRPFLDAESPFALRFDVPPPSVFSPVLPFPLSPEVLVVDG